MSIFKEKDDFLTNALKNQFDTDSSDEEIDDDAGKDSELDQSVQESQGDKADTEKEETIDSENSMKKRKVDSQECILITNDDLESSSNECCIVIDNSDTTPSKRPEIYVEDNLDGSMYTSQTSDARSPEDQNRVQTRYQHKLRQQHNSINDTIRSETIETVNLSHDDFDFNLKLIISGSYRQFQTTYKTRLCDALSDVLDELKASDKSLIITSDTSSSVSLDETPFSLNLTPGSILRAIEVTSKPMKQKPDSAQPFNPDEITVKLQDGNRKHLKEFRTNIRDPVLKLKEAYAKEFSIESLDSIKLFFDGDCLEDEMTPEELDMEDENVIDVIISS